MTQKVFKTSTGKEKVIDLQFGDIAKIPAEAIITAINPGGDWYGGIDGVIYERCGQQFHNQAEDAMPLQDKQVIVAKKKTPHDAKFTDVIFVVDALKVFLNQIIQAALSGANTYGYKHVSLPAIRTGVMLGVVEPNAEQAVIQLLRGIDQHFVDFPDSTVEHITFVIWEPMLVHENNPTPQSIGGRLKQKLLNGVTN